jgi:hypothetical protein
VLSFDEAAGEQTSNQAMQLIDSQLPLLTALGG